MSETHPVAVHFVTMWRDDEGNLLAMDLVGRAYQRIPSISAAAEEEMASRPKAYEEEGEWERAEAWDHPESNEVSYQISREWGEPLPVEVTNEINIDEIRESISLDINVSQN